MVKIRYADLPDGMHAQAQGSGRQTVIYLAPGLSPGQRTAALRRLIRASRRGHGPRLRRPAVSLAVARESVRATLRNGSTAARCHPVGSLAIAALLTAAVVCYAVFVSVTIRLNPRPGPPGAQGAPPVVRESGVPLPGSGPGRRGGPSGGSAGGPGAASAAAPSPGRSAPGTAGAPSQLAASPTPLATASGATPSPSAQPSSAAPSPAPDPASSSSSGRPGGVCLSVGPLGVCVSV